MYFMMNVGSFALHKYVKHSGLRSSQSMKSLSPNLSFFLVTWIFSGSDMFNPFLSGATAKCYYVFQLSQVKSIKVGQKSYGYLTLSRSYSY